MAFLESEKAQFWIHTLYEISGIVLGIGILLTFVQLLFLKKDMVTRSRRSSAEQSIYYIKMYSEEILNTHGIPDKVVGDAAYIKELRSRNQDNSLNMDGSHFFEKYHDEHGFNYPLVDKDSDEFRDAYWRVESDLVTILNYLEIFSVAMNKGVADETIAFVPLSNHFCGFVKANYTGICQTRQLGAPYENIETLFNKWDSRVKHINSIKESKRLAAEADAQKKTAAGLEAQSRGTKTL